jgi:hypothetical protein
MQSIAPSSTWYVTTADEALDPTPARSADGAGLVAVVRSTTADEGRVLVLEAPGAWRETFAFDAPADDLSSQEASSAGQAYLVGVAPGGGTAALWTPSHLVIGDLEAGAATALAPGTVFVGWPTAPIVATDRLAVVPACEAATPDDAASVALSAAGGTSPASAGALPVMGKRQDPDPFRLEEVASTAAVEADVDGILTLALPPGACAESTMSEAMPVDDGPGTTSVPLGAWSAGNGTISGLVPVVAPPAGEWIVRVTLWLDGADREAILLYRVSVTLPDG